MSFVRSFLIPFETEGTIFVAKRIVMKMSAENIMFFISVLILVNCTYCRVLIFAPDIIRHRKSMNYGTCFLSKERDTGADNEQGE